MEKVTEPQEGYPDPQHEQRTELEGEMPTGPRGTVSGTVVVQWDVTGGTDRKCRQATTVGVHPERRFCLRQGINHDFDNPSGGKPVHARSLKLPGHFQCVEW